MPMLEGHRQCEEAGFFDDFLALLQGGFFQTSR